MYSFLRRDKPLFPIRPTHDGVIIDIVDRDVAPRHRDADHLDLALDVVDLPLLGLALGAVEGVDPRVASFPTSRIRTSGN